MNKYGKLLFLIISISVFYLFFTGMANSACNNVTREAALATLTRYPPTNQGIQDALPGLQVAFGSDLRILEHPRRLDKSILETG